MFILKNKTVKNLTKIRTRKIGILQNSRSFVISWFEEFPEFCWQKVSKDILCSGPTMVLKWPLYCPWSNWPWLDKRTYGVVQGALSTLVNRWFSRYLSLLDWQPWNILRGFSIEKQSSKPTLRGDYTSNVSVSMTTTGKYKKKLADSWHISEKNVNLVTIVSVFG